MNKKHKPIPKSTFFASCPREIEPMLEKEIKDFGIEYTEVKSGGVLFKTEDVNGIKFLVNTRLASRVFKSFSFMNVRNEKDLYNKAVKEPWSKALSLQQTFKIQTLFDFKAKSFFKNSVAISQILKDAIVDKFREEFGERPNVVTKKPDVPLLLRLESPPNSKGWNATVFIDLCGEPLSNRGYRDGAHKAPIRENLAAALVMSSDWDPETDIFFDPMCGSGTILIEAILIKGKIPPTYLRIKQFVEAGRKTFAFLNQVWFTEKTFVSKEGKKYLEDVYNNCLSAINDFSHYQFFGNDLDKRNLNLVRQHLRNAWLPDDLIELYNEDATKFHDDEIEAPGVIVTNPPYGERLGKGQDLGDLYYELGENLKANYKGFRAYIFTSEPDLRKNISLQTSRRIKFYNGNIECRLLRYEMR